MADSPLAAIVRAELNEAAKQMKKILPKATGRTAKAIKVVVRNDQDFEIRMPDYMPFVLSGRGPGGVPPIAKIQAWMDATGKGGTSAYAIAITISEKGSLRFRTKKTLVPKFEKIFADAIKRIKTKTIRYLNAEFRNKTKAFRGL